MIAETNSTAQEARTITYQEMMCSPTYVGKVGQIATFFSAANIILSITAFLGNFLILVALNKESSLHSSSKLLYRCLATSDLLVGLVSQPLYAAYWLSLVHEKWNLCRFVTDAIFITRFTSCGVSMLTMATISVDRLLALSLGPRYRQIVTPKRMYIITAIFWIASILASSFYNSQIPLLYNKIVILSFSVISFTSYTKILRILSRNQARVQDHFQEQPSQATALNMARYRKAVSSALWVQLALVVCYAPSLTLSTLVIIWRSYSSHLLITSGITTLLVYLKSTLNPFLYCWKIDEVRQAVKQTIRQVFRCP